jgi:hypothetical protein
MSSFLVDKSLSEEETNKNRRALGQRWVFIATFTNYAMAHWTRKYQITNL